MSIPPESTAEPWSQRLWEEIEGTFDSPEYVMDAATLGIPKGWIIIGHNMSEESGMQEMADWLRPIVPEVKVAHVRAGIVYWVPK